MIDTSNLDSVIGATVVDSSGDKIGKAGQVYLDDVTGQPEWVTVATGLFGTKESFVPLSQATLTGDQLQVPFTKAKVKDAPGIDSDGHMTPDEETQLYSYYGMGDSTSTTTTGTVTDTTTGVYDQSRTVGHDTSGPNTDDAMTRSEERLNVGVQKVQSGVARLRKYIVTEQQTVTVPVSREEVRVVREPITEANIGQAMSGGDLTEEEHEVILTEERAVVNKETVPVERVRLETETVTQNQTVTEDVRKEVIEQVDVDAVTTRDSTLDDRR